MYILQNCKPYMSTFGELCTIWAKVGQIEWHGICTTSSMASDRTARNLPDEAPANLTINTRLRFKPIRNDRSKVRPFNEVKIGVTKGQNEECEFCDSRKNLDYHRIIPGFLYESWNVIILCKKCHFRVHAKINKGLHPWDALEAVKNEINS